MIDRVAADQWHALDDLVVGRGQTMRKPDGRDFISIDAWRAEDAETTPNRRRVGSTGERRERQYLVKLANLPRAAETPAGVRITGGGDEFRATADGAEIGVIRLSSSMRDDGTPRPARILFVEVRADQRRRGIGRALLLHALGDVHTRGFGLASTEVDETDTAAILLLEGVGARRASNSLELKWQK
ncbi:GNAT family N-acetyltransferase [Amycolatopsis sp. OK19-0408]|uniref:GNAT family N-acetyltransferase n=1 Tax=Amycolatopsis iheyensis TaxID=2945988 RepID=A0A9X2NLK7_9PSEU|nr:GNAT family N-acetyltransferase [Amycolatopsis iheyensis]MCR6488764.1 GNAT family N-acetyltransferase [Amycolatopsis iheyensis]